MQKRSEGCETCRRRGRRRRAALAAVVFLCGAGALRANIPDTFTSTSSTSWNVIGNWSAGIPNSSAYDVTIGSGSISTINFNIVGSTQIDSLALSSAVLNINSGCSLTALNPAVMTNASINSSAAFSAPLTTSADGMIFSATNGGSISLGSLGSYNALSVNPTMYANGVGTLINLPVLTSATVTSNLYLEANAGGDVEAPNLSTLSFPNSGEGFCLFSTGANSLVDVPALGSKSITDVYVQVHTGGNVSWGSPTTVTNSTLLMDTAGTLNTMALTNIDGTQLTSTNGATFSIPIANFNAGSANPQWISSNANSKLILPNLTAISTNSNFSLQATSGGDIEVPKLSSVTYISGGYADIDFNLSATGAGSIVNVSALTPVLTDLYVTAKTGGTINWGSPTTVTNSTLTLDTAGTLNTTALTNIDGTQLTSTNGATFSLPIASYNAGSANPQWVSSNANSKLILPNLTAISTNSNFGLQALSGGDIETPKLSSVTFISGGFASIDFALSATGAGSIINASGLSPLLNDLYVTVKTGGTLNWGSPTVVTNSTLILDTAGTLNTTALISIDGTQLTSTNGATFSLPVASFNAGSGNPQWVSSNANSKLLLPNLTAITSNSNFGLQALSGGDVEVPKLSSVTYISGGYASIDFALSATGTGSIINVSGLNPVLTDLYVVAKTGGTINWGSPTAVTFSNLTINTAGTLNTAALLNIDGTQLTATSGATFSLPVAAYNASNVNPQWAASSAGSVLSLPNLTAVSTNSNFGLTASTGGDIEVPKLSSVTFIPGGLSSIDMVFKSTGTNSLIDAVDLLSVGTATTLSLGGGGEILLGGTGTPMDLSFQAKFTNATGSLNIYEGATLVETIPANNLNTTESYSFINLPASSSLEFLSVGSNSAVAVTSYAVVAVPEPASVVGMICMLYPLGRRRGRWRM